jgi:tRNA pseudouridine55 synthase
VALGIDTARAIAGALLIDKPAGPTSHDIVAFVRRTLKVDRAGHTGTLDPLATGLLIVLVGTATRLARFVAADEKEYIADVRLGIATPTYDAASLDEGVRSPMADERWPPEAEIDKVLAQFRGSFLQVPPPYSAKKVAGVPAFEKARKNQHVDLQPVTVTVRELQMLPTSTLDHRSSDIGHRASTIEHRGLLRLRVAASAGFYVRSLTHDIGKALGCGAHLETLRRTRAGRYRIDDALTLDRLEMEGPQRLVSPSALLGHMPSVTVTEHGAGRVAHGNPLSPGHLEKRDSPPEPPMAAPGPFFRVLDDAGQLLAVAEPRPGGVLQPVVVLG